MTRNRWFSTLALIAGAGLVVGLGVLPAVGDTSTPSSPVILGDTAQVVNRGAGALPFALVVCQPGDFAQLSISLTEKSGNGIASGFGYTDVNCNGQIQTITVPISANGKPFVKGTAFGQATLFVCSNNCTETTDSDSVKLLKKGNGK
jgi:hypothetical protein